MATPKEYVEDVYSLKDYFKKARAVGFQSTELGKAREILKRVIELKKKKKITLFLSFTANIIASGARGILSSFISTGVVDAIITTAGALEHDVMKAFFKYEIYRGERDEKLKQKGYNRIYNIIVPTRAYEKLEKINFELFKAFVEKKKLSLPPSQLARAYALYLEKHSKKAEESFLYQAYKRDIPVFCPGIIDGAIGLNLYFFRKLRKRYSSFSIDPSLDIERLASIVLGSSSTAGLVIGGGISKHHLIGSNILRGGLDYAIYISTSSPEDGSLSGAEPKEAISWSKLSSSSSFAFVKGEATLVLPLLFHGFF